MIYFDYYAIILITGQYGFDGNVVVITACRRIVVKDEKIVSAKETLASKIRGAFASMSFAPALA